MEKKTFEERYFDEALTDNAALNHYGQCKDCIFRDKTTVNNTECGWKKCYCLIFKKPQSKPNEIYDNSINCEYNEKQKNKKHFEN